MSGQAPLAWTEDRVAILRSSLAKGFSAREIAFELGVTRNAVIGKVNRLHLSLPTKSSITRLRKRAAGVAKASARAAAILEETKPPAPVDLMDLTSRQCRWPTWRDRTRPPFRFCGRRIERGSYCETHAKRAYTKKGGADAWS